jgi:hypothetical protein
MKQTKKTANSLQVIPGVGKSIANDLNRLGIKKVSGLRGKDPEKLYLRFCAMEGYPVDRCLLYVFRCAVYYASHDRHDPELLKWWNWADTKLKINPSTRASASLARRLRARNKR